MMIYDNAIAVYTEEEETGRCWYTILAQGKEQTAILHLSCKASIQLYKDLERKLRETGAI